MLTLKFASQFRPTTQQPNQFDPCTATKSRCIPYPEIKSISTTHTKTKSFSMLAQNQVNRSSPFLARAQQLSQSYSPHKKQVNFDPHTKKISNLTPHTKSSQFQCLQRNQVHSDPHAEITSISTKPQHNNEIIFHLNTKTMQFSARVVFVLVIRVHVPVIQQQYLPRKYQYDQFVLVLTCRYCRKPRKYCVGIYHGTIFNI